MCNVYVYVCYILVCVKTKTIGRVLMRLSYTKFCDNKICDWPVLNLFQLVLPEYLIHIVFNFIFMLAGEWFSVILNVPLIAYNINR